MTDMFYQRIRQKLDELGISDREASMKVSGTPDLIRNIKRGKSESLRGPRLVKLAALLGVSPIWLQTGWKLVCFSSVWLFILKPCILLENISVWDHATFHAGTIVQIPSTTLSMCGTD